MCGCCSLGRNGTLPFGRCFSEMLGSPLGSAPYKSRRYEYHGGHGESCSRYPDPAEKQRHAAEVRVLLEAGRTANNVRRREVFQREACDPDTPSLASLEGFGQPSRFGFGNPVLAFSCPKQQRLSPAWRTWSD